MDWQTNKKIFIDGTVYFRFLVKMKKKGRPVPTDPMHVNIATREESGQFSRRVVVNDDDFFERIARDRETNPIPTGTIDVRRVVDILFALLSIMYRN